MKRAIPYSHVSPQKFAKFVGLNPIHFQGGVVPEFFQHLSNCSSIWRKHTWQSPENVSHEDLAIQLVSAEQTISQALGFPIAPSWYVHDFPYPQWRKGLSFMRDRRGRFRSINLEMGKLINPGVRGVTLLNEFPVEYRDLDGDGYKETAAVLFDVEPDWSSLRLYFHGTNADPRWEIRPVRRYNTDAWEAEIDSWLLIKPELRSAFPKDADQNIRVDVEANLVSTVDGYTEYNNQDVPTVTFMWNDGHTQDGYMEVVDKEAGAVRPVPANFIYEPECTKIDVTGRCYDSEPDLVRLRFYAGKRSDDYMNQYIGYEHDPLDPFLTETVIFLATARLSRELCGCTNVRQFGKDMREDMALVSPQGNFLAVADEIQVNRFGTRRGEWLAGQRVKYYGDAYVSAALV